MSIPVTQLPSKIVFTRKDGTKDYFLRHEELGQGGFSSVYRVTQQSTNQEYAMKVISKKLLNSKGEVTINRLKNELKIQKSLNHPNIVKSKVSFSDDFNYYIVLENCPGKSVREFLRSNNEHGYLSEPQTRKILRDVIKGLAYLHSNNIIHHDIKLENFLIGSNGVVKIADFGLSTILNKDDQKQFNICGTINYISPEILKRKNHSFEVDIWAMGVAAFTMLTGKAPFYNIKRDLIYENIKSGTYSFPAIPQISPEAKSFIKMILKVNPMERPSATDLLDHPFLTKFDRELIDFFKPMQFHKVRSEPLLICNDIQTAKQKKTQMKVQSLLQSDSDSNNSNQIGQKIRSLTPVQKVQPPIPPQKGQHQNVAQNQQKTQSPQKAPILSQSAQKVRAPTPSRYIQKIDAFQKFSNDQNEPNAQNQQANLRNIAGSSKLRSSSVNNPRTRQPISNEQNLNLKLSRNNGDLIRSCTTFTRKNIQQQQQQSSLNAGLKKTISIPNNFVIKYCLQGENIAYLLGNGTVGICFSCLSTIVMDPNENFVQYHSNSSDSSFESINLYEYMSKHKKAETQKDLLFNKIIMLIKFAGLLKKSKNSAEIETENFDPNVPLPHVKFFLSKNDSFLFKLSDRNIQVNFNDHSKMIIFWLTKKVCFFRAMNDKCQLIDLNEIINMNANTDEKQKYRNAKLMLSELSKKIHNFTKH